MKIQSVSNYLAVYVCKSGQEMISKGKKTIGSRHEMFHSPQDMNELGLIQEVS